MQRDQSQRLAAPYQPAFGESVVFVVDDDVSVRESLEPLIRSAGWHVESFESAQHFLARPHRLMPCCLILDISMPGLDGLSLQKHIAADRANVPIIFITGHGDVPKTVQAIKAGAVDFLTKPFQDDVLLDAIETALNRSSAALDQQAQMLALRDRYATVSPREREVMAFVVAGVSNKQIGTDLGISEVTVKVHRGSAMRKMKAASLADLVNMSARLENS